MQKSYKLIKTYNVPTGKIAIIKSHKRLVECLSLGDYGKERNIKADFLNLKNDIIKVDNGNVMPLEEKWVITISSQFGCSMGCKFCDVPKVGPGINCKLSDLHNQLMAARFLYPNIHRTKRLNIHYARMGEPTFNDAVLGHAVYLTSNKKEVMQDLRFKKLHIHPVVSTMLPNNNTKLFFFLNNWCKIVKNRNSKGEAGLQYSINSTSDEQRNDMFNGNSLKLEEISEMSKKLPMPKGRKYTLNFALADNFEVDAEKLVKLFDINKFMVKITPIHNTGSCKSNNIQTSDGYTAYESYKDKEKALKDVGFDVLVFVPSEEEEAGLITCGNAILSGSIPREV